MTDDNQFDDEKPKKIAERLALLPNKVRRLGFSWLMSRVRDEVNKIVTYLMSVVFTVQRRTLHLFAILLKPMRRISGQTLVAVYDLDAYPPSFDICFFLVWADLERQRRGLKRMHTMFIPANEDLRTYNPGYDAVIDRESRAWRLRNICIAAADFVPSNNGVTMAQDRIHAVSQEITFAHLFPRPYVRLGMAPSLTTIRRETMAALTEMQDSWTGLRATPQGLQYARQWIEAHCRGRKPITISFRQYGYDTDRNSNIAAWVAFARTLDSTRYCPVFIPDTDASLGGQPECAEFHVMHAAAWNLGLRMAVYELAHLNMFTSSGHLDLCVLNPVSRYLFFKIVVPSSPLATEKHLSSLGFDRGKTPAFASPFQKWVWEDDDQNVIEREFTLMTQNIDTAESAEKNLI